MHELRPIHADAPSRLKADRLAQRFRRVLPPSPGQPKDLRRLASLRHRRPSDRAALPTSEPKQNYAPMQAKNDQKTVATVKSWSGH
jgi:hypothetical protein